MKFKKINETFIVRLDSGERVLETLKIFCVKNSIKCGYFLGIGSLEEAELAHYIAKAKKYTSKILKQPLEIISMNGNITTMNKEVYLHCHITLSDEKMNAIAGHLKEGTSRIFITAKSNLFTVKVFFSILINYNLKIRKSKTLNTQEYQLLKEGWQIER